MNRHITLRLGRQTWAISVGFLLAFCWLGWAAVRFGSIFQGMDIERSLPAANWLALAYGPIAFPLFGVVAAAAFIVSELLFRNRWMRWALIVLFAFLIVWGFRALLIGGVFIVPNNRANKADAPNPVICDVGQRAIPYETPASDTCSLNPDGLRYHAHRDYPRANLEAAGTR
jgi:hypothetical protein